MGLLNLLPLAAHAERPTNPRRHAAVNRDTEILFDVGDDALLVANGGRPFSGTGVISICASYLSDKSSDQENQGVKDHFGAEDSDLVQCIQEREPATYRNDPNRITADYQAQDEVRRDYGGRFAWELLQNADDAMGPDRSSAQLIGSKGLASRQWEGRSGWVESDSWNVAAQGRIKYRQAVRVAHKGRPGASGQLGQRRP